MKRPILVLLLSVLYFSVDAQQNLAVIDSFKAKLSRAHTSEEKIEVLAPLTLTLMSSDIPESDRYGDLMTREAELSRNRSLMFKALQVNGQRYAFFVGNKDFLQKATVYYDKALSLARENKMDKESAEALLSLASVYMLIPDLEKSMSYTTQASGIASALRNDSLQAVTYYSYGAIYQLKKERLLALRNYLNALRIAEEMKNHTLLRSCYTVLSQFYADIKAYDKAIDFSQKASDQLPLIKVDNSQYIAVVDLYMLGDLYMQKKDYEMSRYYYEKSIRGADSLKYEPLKMPGYRGLLRQYMQGGHPEKALAYLNASAELKAFITKFGAAHIVDYSYASIYTQLGKYDSAQYYFGKAEPGFEKTGTPSSKLSFYFQYGDFFSKTNNNPKAIEYYSKADTLANTLHDLEWQEQIAKVMDTVYAKSGDFKQARYYNGLYTTYKDSLQKLGEEKDLMQMELADEQQRQERLSAEEAARLERAHTVQYMGISIAIAIVFVLLVAMGMFKVSEATIKIMGFFAFILLFEFIILLADNKIHHWTHGEPLQVLGIKIVLIAMLLPLHHWLEHKVVSYLASRRLIVPGKNIWNNIVNRRKAAADKH